MATRKNPLAAVHATRTPDPVPDSPGETDADRPDALYIAIVQGLAANPASAGLSPEDFAVRADQLTAALGVPASMLGDMTGVTATEHEYRQRHVATLLGILRTHPNHEPGACEVCAARAFLEELQ